MPKDKIFHVSDVQVSRCNCVVFGRTIWKRSHSPESWNQICKVCNQSVKTLSLSR